MNVAVHGCGAVTRIGLGWRGLADLPSVGRQPDDTEFAVNVEPPPATGKQRMARRLMARSAFLAHLALEDAIADSNWADLHRVGLFMGVGASGGAIEQVEQMIEPSLCAGQVSWEAFGGAGLRACNPLFAFQLMNNFTMCHAAILADVRGPNQVLFSRGDDTLGAIEEAVWSLKEGECTRAFAGGADSSRHPVTQIEVERERNSSVCPGEAAAVLSLSSQSTGAVATITHCDAMSRPATSGEPGRYRSSRRWTTG